MIQKLQALSVFWLVLATGAFGQTTRSRISGTVKDNTGAVAGAQVKLSSEDTGVERTAATEKGGEFVFPLVAPGGYRIEVSKAGFQSYSQTLDLILNQELRVDVPLLTTSRQTVEVTAARGLLKPDTASLGATIDNRLVQGLPLNGRNFLELALLVPDLLPRPKARRDRSAAISRYISTAAGRTGITSYWTGFTTGIPS